MLIAAKLARVRVMLWVRNTHLETIHADQTPITTRYCYCGPVQMCSLATSAVRDQVNINSYSFHLAEKPTLPKIKASRRRERTS